MGLFLRAFKLNFTRILFKLKFCNPFGLRNGYKAVTTVVRYKKYCCVFSMCAQGRLRNILSKEPVKWSELSSRIPNES